MAVPVATTTELDAVNRMLWTIGERPVNSLEANLFQAKQARRILEDNNRDIQAVGWNFNTERGVLLSKDANDEFLIGADILHIDTTNFVFNGSRDTFRPSAHIPVAVRRDGGQRKLVDLANNTTEWPDVDNIMVERVRLYDYDDVPLGIQTYIWRKAAYEWQQGAVASQVLYEISLNDVQEAMINAMYHDERMADTNIHTAIPHLVHATRRYNPAWGRR